MNEDKTHGFLYSWEVDKELASAVLRGHPHGEVKAKHSGSTEGGNLGHPKGFEGKAVLEMNLRRVISNECERRTKKKSKCTMLLCLRRWVVRNGRGR